MVCGVWCVLCRTQRVPETLFGVALIQQAFEVAGMRRSSPFAQADVDEASLKEFTCLRIDGSVPTSMRYVTRAVCITATNCTMLVSY